MYKYINEHKIEKFCKGFVVIDDRVFTNPSEDTLRKAGYKRLIKGAVPEYDPATQYPKIKYIDGDDITETFDIVEYQPAEEIPDEITE